MKYILAFSLLFATLFSHAQNLRVTNHTNGTTDSLWFTHQEYVTHVFGNLNLQEVTTNFLLQRSLSYFNPFAYDGKNGNDSIIRSNAQALSIYSSFYYSALDTAASYSPTHPQLLLDRLNEFYALKQVPIGLINHSYQSIKQNALFDGLLTTNVDSTVLYDNVSRTVSPYEKHRLFVSRTYTKENIYRSFGDITYNILPSMINVTDTLSGQIQIDFGDGAGYLNVTPNTLQTISYATSGVKTIKVKQGGLESISTINFVRDTVFFNGIHLPLPPPAESVRGGMGTMSAANPSQPVMEQFLGCDQVFDKPILVVEGFEIEQGFSAVDILRGLNGSGLVTRLQTLGYDFVVVKFSENSASIYENADALRSAINTVNSTKIGSHGLNVIGLSMGGLIAKYCLKDMEDKSETHNVTNYFSYDAPHQGAYMPLGLQHLLVSASRAVKIIRNDDLVKLIISKLESDAGRQLLQLHKDGPLINGRSAFAGAYAAKGYPSQSNNYGIANGRADGIGLNYPEGSPLMDFYSRIGIFLKHTQQLYTTSTSLATTSYFSNKGIAAVLGIKGMKSSSSRLSTYGEISHETVPGSSVSVHPEYGNGLKAGFDAAGGSGTLNYFGRLLTTFVPTVSALDLNNQNYSANGLYISRNPYYDIATNRATVISSHITPFADIIYPATSQDHLATDFAISDFIFTKVYGAALPTGCAGLCTFTANFTGLSQLCNVPNPAVTLTNVPSGVIITWHLPSGLQVLSGQSTNSIKINHAATGIYTGGYVTVTWPGCTSTNYPFAVEFTEPTSISGPTHLCGSATYTIPNLPNGAVVTWEVVGDYAEITENYNDHVVLSGLDIGQVKLKATIVSSCGTHVVESPYINNGWPYYVTLTDIQNDGMGTSQGYLCSDAYLYDNYYNTYSYTIPSGSGPVTLHTQIYSSSGLVYSNEVTVNGSGTQKLPGDLPNGTYTLDVWISGGPCNESTDLAEVEIYYQTCDQSKVSIYPNPAKSEIKVGFSSDAKNIDISKVRQAEEFSVKLFNDKGRLVRESKAASDDNWEIRLQVADLPNGTYFIHVFEGKKVTKRQVIVSH